MNDDEYITVDHFPGKWIGRRVECRVTHSKNCNSRKSIAVTRTIERCSKCGISNAICPGIKYRLDTSETVRVIL